MQKFTNSLHTFSSPFQDAAAYCKAETRSNSFMAIAEESVLTVTVHRSNVLKEADEQQSPPGGVLIKKPNSAQLFGLFYAMGWSVLSTFQDALVKWHPYVTTKQKGV